MKEPNGLARPLVRAESRWTASHRLLFERSPMWRAMFLAVGISMCILGAECLVVEKFVLGGEGTPTAESPATLFGSSASASIGTPGRELEPPDWAPWSMLSAGAVVILYAVTLNRQGG